MILNLEKTQKDESETCILDFLSGVAYANDGKIALSTRARSIITPYNVDLSGDEVMDELEQNGVYFTMNGDEPTAGGKGFADCVRRFREKRPAFLGFLELSERAEAEAYPPCPRGKLVLFRRLGGMRSA